MCPQEKRGTSRISGLKAGTFWMNSKKCGNFIKKKRRPFKRWLKTATAFLLAAAFIVINASVSFALEPWNSDCYVLSEGACLMDGDSGVVLFDQHAEESYYPASITKIMTALLVIENCENLSEIVTFSYDAVTSLESNSTIIGASEGDRLSVLDCLYCLLFQSANEVANALAEHVGAKYPDLKEKGMSDQDVFVILMNKKAEELGCKGTHFNNPSGLTDENHYTTPYDMCLIMAACIKNDTFCDIESHTYWKHAPIKRYPDADDPWNTVYMKHLMLRKNSNQYYQGTIAGKTGYTMTAGNTLVTACRKYDHTLVCCVMNAHANHYNDTRQLFDFGYSNFRSVAVADYDSVVSDVQSDYMIMDVPVLDGYTLGIDGSSRITIPKGGDYSEVTRELVTENMKSDTALAEINYYYGDRLVGTAEFRLVPLGGMQEVAEALEDPMYYKIAGIEMPETETESIPDAEDEEGNAEEGADGSAGESAEDSAGEAENGTDTEATAADGNKGISALGAVAICAGVILLLAGAGYVYLYIRRKREIKRRRAMAMRRRRQMRERAENTRGGGSDRDKI